MTRNIILTALAYLALLTSSATARAGGSVGNGGGASEKYMIYAYLNLGRYIQICLDSSVCDLSATERRVLSEISDSLPEEYKSSHQLRFLSGKKYRAFFTINGVVRVSETGKLVGDPIYIYSDELYSNAGRPISLGFAIANLIHEMTHHHGIKDSATDLPDILGEQVARSVSMKSLVATADIPRWQPSSQNKPIKIPAWQTISATYLDDSQSLPGSRELLISDNSTLFDESAELSEQVFEMCYPYQVTDFKIANLSWGLPEYFGIYSQYVRTPLHATVVARCLPNPDHPKAVAIVTTFWMKNDVGAQRVDDLQIDWVNSCLSDKKTPFNLYNRSTRPRRLKNAQDWKNLRNSQNTCDQ